MTEFCVDLTQSEQYTLSIRLSTDGFSFSIHHPSRPEEGCYQRYPVNTQRSMAANIKAFLNDTPILKKPFGQTNILVHSQRYTSIPFELFEDEQAETLFYQNLPKQNNEIILCNILGHSNLAVLFSIDKLTHLFLSEQFPGVRFFSAVSPQIEYIVSRHKAPHANRIYANLHPGSMDIFCFRENRLQLLNSFAASTLNDRCYYLLNLWKQLKYNQEEDEMYLTCAEYPVEEIKEILSSYIWKIMIINPQAELGNLQFTKGESIPFDMQTLLTCV